MESVLNDKAPIKKGQFFQIYDLNDEFLLLDKTKKGLTAIERGYDEKFDTDADKGMIYIDGRGYKVNICWHFPKHKFGIEHVLEKAMMMEEYYKRLREETCPD